MQRTYAERAHASIREILFRYWSVSLSSPSGIQCTWRRAIESDVGTVRRPPINIRTERRPTLSDTTFPYNIRRPCHKLNWFDWKSPQRARQSNRWPFRRQVIERLAANWCRTEGSLGLVCAASTESCRLHAAFLVEMSTRASEREKINTNLVCVWLVGEASAARLNKMYMVGNARTI